MSVLSTWLTCVSCLSNLSILSAKPVRPVCPIYHVHPLYPVRPVCPAEEYVVMVICLQFPTRLTVVNLSICGIYIGKTVQSTLNYSKRSKFISGLVHRTFRTVD